MTDVIRNLRLLILLNIADAVFSYTGFITKNMKEANPLMQKIIQNPFLLIVGKIFIPTIIFILLIKNLRNTNHRFSRLALTLIDFAVYAYAAVLFLHAGWMWKVVIFKKF